MKLPLYLALLIPACLPATACSPAQLEKIDTTVATVASECQAARADYETISAGVADACTFVNALPDSPETSKAKAACGGSTVVDRYAKRVVRICGAVQALGVPQ